MIPKAFFSKGMEAFCRKSGGSQKRECPSQYHYPPVPRHFERSEKSSLHNGQRESVRGGTAETPRRFYHYLISTEHRQGVKDPSAPLGMTIREDADISHSLSFLHVEGCPFGADLSSAFGAPLLQGATQRSCKNADPSQGLLSRIVISSAARNLPCTTVKRRA